MSGPKSFSSREIQQEKMVVLSPPAAPSVFATAFAYHQRYVVTLSSLINLGSVSLISMELKRPI